MRVGCRHESFKSWWGRHAELQSILQRMLWRNPVSALTSPLDVASGMTDSISVVDARNGAVLSKLTILKEEPYPGLQKEDLPTRIEGAPNFRQVGLSLNSTTALLMYARLVVSTASLPTDRSLS
jgi:hypothetical protein